VDGHLLVFHGFLSVCVSVQIPSCSGLRASLARGCKSCQIGARPHFNLVIYVKTISKKGLVGLGLYLSCRTWAQWSRGLGFHPSTKKPNQTKLIPPHGLLGVRTLINKLGWEFH
jgi:hypothetical protein